MRRCLLDTHALLWWLADAPELGERCKQIISDERNEIFVSAATTWEISIKMALGKLTAPEDMDSVVEDEVFQQTADQPCTMVNLPDNCRIFIGTRLIAC